MFLEILSINQRAPFLDEKSERQCIGKDRKISGSEPVAGLHNKTDQEYPFGQTRGQCIRSEPAGNG